MKILLDKTTNGVTSFIKNWLVLNMQRNAMICFKSLYPGN